MTARDALDGMKARASVVRRCLRADPNDSYDMSDLDKAAESIPTDAARLIGAVEAVLSECDYLDTLAAGDKHYAAGFRKLIENAITQ